MGADESGPAGDQTGPSAHADSSQGKGNLRGKRRTTKEPAIRRVTWPVILSLGLIAGLTLWPIPAQAPLSAATPFFCLPCGDAGFSDLVLNVLLFLPLGLSLGGAGWRVWQVALIAAVITLTVELLQYTVVAGRDPSAADLATNTLGAVGGAALAGSVRQLIFPGRRTAALLAFGWAIAASAATLLTAWSLDASLRSTTWYGQWAPYGGEPEWFDGAILSVFLGRRPLPHWKLPDSEARRTALLEDTLTLAAKVVTIRPPPGRLRIVALADSAGRMITLSQRGRDLDFSVRTRAADLALHSPAFRVRDAFRAQPGDTILLAGEYHRGWARVQTAWYELSSLDGWALLVPPPVGTPLASVAAVVWLVCLYLPIGFYGGQVRQGSWAIGPAILLMTAPVLIAMATGTPLPAPWEVAVAALAALTGRVLCAGLEPDSPRR